MPLGARHAERGDVAIFPLRSKENALNITDHVSPDILSRLTYKQRALLHKIAWAISVSEIEIDGTVVAHRRVVSWCDSAKICRRTYITSMQRLREERLIETVYKQTANGARIAWHLFGPEFHLHLPKPSFAPPVAPSYLYMNKKNVLNNNYRYASHPGGNGMKAADFKKEIANKKSRTKGAFDKESLMNLIDFKPAQADRLWKELLSEIGRSAMPLKIGEQKLLAKYLGFDTFKAGLDRAIREWLRFCAFAKTEEGAFGMGNHPNIHAVLKYRDSIAHFAERDNAESPPATANGTRQQANGVDCLPTSSPAASSSTAKKIWDDVAKKES